MAVIVVGWLLCFPHCRGCFGRGVASFLATNDFLCCNCWPQLHDMFVFCLFHFIFDAGIRWWRLLRVDCCVSGAVGDVLEEGRPYFWKKMVLS